MEKQIRRMLTDSCRKAPKGETHGQADHHHPHQTNRVPSHDLKYKRENSDHKRCSEPSDSADATARTEGYVQGISDIPAQYPSSDKALEYKAEKQRYDLLGVGMHSLEHKSTHDEDHIARHGNEEKCPYHRHPFQDRLTGPRYSQASPMDRYLAEGPSERSAVLPQPYRQSNSARTGCRCPDITGSMGNGNHGT